MAVIVIDYDIFHWNTDLLKSFPQENTWFDEAPNYSVCLGNIPMNQIHDILDWAQVNCQGVVWLRVSSSCVYRLLFSNLTDVTIFNLFLDICVFAH